MLSNFAACNNNKSNIQPTIFLHYVWSNMFGFHQRFKFLINLSFIYNSNAHNIKVNMLSAIKCLRFFALSKQHTKLNLTHNQTLVSVDTKLRRLGFTETTRTLGVKEYWKLILKLNFVPDGEVFAISVWHFHMIFHDTLLYYSTYSDVWNILFQWILECARHPSNDIFFGTIGVFLTLNFVVFWVVAPCTPNLVDYTSVVGKYVSWTGRNSEMTFDLCAFPLW
jgi:hypothetical protein